MDKIYRGQMPATEEERKERGRKIATNISLLELSVSEAKKSLPGLKIARIEGDPKRN